MNGIKESIKILVQTLYIEDDSSFILLDDLLKKKQGFSIIFWVQLPQKDTSKSS